jgi:hypothetical protein
MIDIQANKPAELTFKLQIEGSNDTPVSKFSLQLQEGELLFPGTVHGDNVVVRIPALNVFKEQLSKQTEAKLLVFIGDQHFTPWEESVTISNPITVKAEAVVAQSSETLREEIAKPKKPSVAVSVRVIEEEAPKPQVSKKAQKNPNVEEFFKALKGK